MNDSNSKRLGRKIVYVPHEAVIGLLLRRRLSTQYVFIPQCEGLPDTARVVSVHECPERASFLFVVEDESFSMKEPGLHYESIPVTFESVKIKRDEPWKESTSQPSATTNLST